jgi:hypothetical protein
MATSSPIDIAVASSMRNRRLIVVAVKPTHDLEAATEQLSDYLRRSHVPVGLLVGRDVIRLLRYGYKIEPDVEMVGEFPVALAHGLVASDDPAEYADRVQDWLESLGNRWSRIAEPLRSALLLDVVPVIQDGVVGATGPRERRAAH